MSLVINLTNLKVGDRVNRYHGSGFFMEMEIVEIKDGVLTCASVYKNKEGKEVGKFHGDWKFDQASGAEIDHDLKWGPEYGATGTYIKQKEKPDDTKGQT